MLDELVVGVHDDIAREPVTLVLFGPLFCVVALDVDLFGLVARRHDLVRLDLVESLVELDAIRTALHVDVDYTALLLGELFLDLDATWRGHDVVDGNRDEDEEDRDHDVIERLEPSS